MWCTYHVLEVEIVSLRIARACVRALLIEVPEPAKKLLFAFSFCPFEYGAQLLKHPMEPNGAQVLNDPMIGILWGPTFKGPLQPNYGLVLYVMII